MPKLTMVVARPAPNSSSRGSPHPPWISSQTSSALAGMAASVIHRPGSGRLTAPMKPRIARNHSAGMPPHARPSRYFCARCAVAGAWPSISRICSPNSGSAIIGSEIMSAAHSPTRSARRTRRGLRAPNACAASGATAETSPMPKVKVTKNTVCASAAAATASSPSRPINARSVVIIAICPSWVAAMGTASFSVSVSSRARRPRVGAAPSAVAAALGARSILSRDVMG